MAEILRLTNGAATDSVNSNKSVAEVANFARLVTLDKVQPPPEGSTAAEQNQYYITALKNELVRYAKAQAYLNGLRDREAQLQAVRDLAVADSTL